MPEISVDAFQTETETVKVQLDTTQSTYSRRGITTTLEIIHTLYRYRTIQKNVSGIIHTLEYSSCNSSVSQIRKSNHLWSPVVSCAIFRQLVNMSKMCIIRSKQRESERGATRKTDLLDKRVLVCE